MKNKKRFVKSARLFPPCTDGNGYSGAFQLGNAPPMHQRVRVNRRARDSLDSRFDYRFRAWRSPPEMSARLKIDVESCPARTPAGISERFNLRMRTACNPVVSPPDDFPVLSAGGGSASGGNNDSADHRIRSRPAGTFRSELQGFIHKLLVACEHMHQMFLSRWPSFFFFVLRYSAFTSLWEISNGTRSAICIPKEESCFSFSGLFVNSLIFFAPKSFNISAATS